MKKVAIVGVEGSGKTVMLAGLGELYSRPDKDGCFLSPKNFRTAAYVNDKIARMRKGEWPSATAGDEMMGLDWTLKRRDMATRRPPEAVCEVSFLDFAGEVYRAAYGIPSRADASFAEQAEALKRYVREANELLVLINLGDVIVNGIDDPRAQEAMWVTRSILDTALANSGGRRPPRAAIVLSQADSYANTIKACGGPSETLQKYLPHVANDYSYLDIFAVNAVDKTALDESGRIVPSPDFTLNGLVPIVDWILERGPAAKSGDAEFASSPVSAFAQEYGVSKPKSGSNGCLFFATVLLVAAIAGGVAYHRHADTEADGNPEAARYRLEAEQGDADAQYNLGVCYDNGQGVDEDDAEAVKWYRKSAEQGHAGAQYNLGWCYDNGKGVDEDDAEAVKWYRKAAEQGDADAQYNLGVCYDNGQGVDEDDAEAVKWYRKAAEQGYAEAQNALRRRGLTW